MERVLSSLEIMSIANVLLRGFDFFLSKDQGIDNKL